MAKIKTIKIDDNTHQKLKIYVATNKIQTLSMGIETLLEVAKK